LTVIRLFFNEYKLWGFAGLLGDVFCIRVERFFFLGVFLGVAWDQRLKGRKLTSELFSI
jgi:hypothetical protein